jgi:hypothetical protein
MPRNRRPAHEHPIDYILRTGTCTETVIAATVQRLNFYQTASNARFACMENLEAIEYLLKALEVLQERTARRIEQQTEGTHEGA